MKKLHFWIVLKLNNGKLYVNRIILQFECYEANTSFETISFTAFIESSYRSQHLRKMLHQFYFLSKKIVFSINIQYMHASAYFGPLPKICVKHFVLCQKVSLEVWPRFFCILYGCTKHGNIILMSRGTKCFKLEVLLEKIFYLVAQCPKS